MDKQIARDIESGKTVLGIELGSTRIKAVLIDLNHKPIANGSYTWQNKLIDGLWTYDLAEVHTGLQKSYQDLSNHIKHLYGLELKTVGAIGISGMMHGYLAFDENDQLLVPFRTWRNTNTEKAASALSETLQFNMPLRWSVSHLYQAVIDGEPHIQEVRYITTLAGYVHWMLTGEKVLGVGDASGMFPICAESKGFDEDRLSKFSQLIAPYRLPWGIKDILPKVLCAGEKAGCLTEAGAKMLDTNHKLLPNIPLAPPEGDAGTGMVATHAVAPRTGNVSVGTSIFAMFVLEKPLKKHYREIDMVTTPAGDAVAMVHCNNGTSDIDAWVHLFKEAIAAFDETVDMARLYEMLYKKSIEGTADSGGIIAYNFLSGEPIVGIEAGRPMVIRQPDSAFSLAGFMRAHLYSLAAGLRLGMETLKKEGISFEQLMGHGGFFKTPEVGQRIMADALQTPIAVTETAGEGGPFGMAVLTAYMLKKECEETLANYLASKVYAASTAKTVYPEEKGMAAFDAYLKSYVQGISVAEKASDVI